MVQQSGGWVYAYTDNSNPSAGFSSNYAANYKIAAYPAGAFGSKDYALKAIYFERKLELAMEGYRYFDLVRWGLAPTLLNSYFSLESKFVTDVIGAHFTAGEKEKKSLPQQTKTHTPK